MLVGFGLVMLYPLLWMISSALKPEEMIFREPGLIPSEITFENFTEAGTRSLIRSVTTCGTRRW